MIDIISANVFARVAILITLFILVVGSAMLVLTTMSRRATVRGQLRAIGFSTP